MSYDFSFSQFPTKEFSELWDGFAHGRLSEHIEKKIIEAQQKQEELLKLPRFSRKTYYEDRDEWVRCQKNYEAAKINEEHIGDWQRLKKTIAKKEELLRNAKTKKEIQRVVKNTLEIFMELFGKNNPYEPRILFIDDCDGYSDSARGNGYTFLRQLYYRVHGVHLDSVKEMPTNEQWYAMFQALKPEFVEKELGVFFANEHIPEAEHKNARKECLHLLHTVKDLLKGCLDRKWDLWFSSEFQATDLETKQRKVLEKECLNIIAFYERIPS